MSENSQSKKFIHALNLVPGIGPQRMKKLMAFFYEPRKAWLAGYQELVASGIGEKISQKLFSERKKIDPEMEWQRLEDENIRILTLDDLEYPRLLKEIHNPPYVLYLKGRMDFINNSNLISIVGSRKYTSYGAQIANSFSRDLAHAGLTVVSGMAIGIDTFAHRSALDSGGKTIAVLGNGLDDKSIYPKNNFSLSREISMSGALLSDYPPGTQAGVQTFPARNRIIAGLSLGTLVIEAGESSGALITADLALEYNREVFSVPGSIFSAASTGTNNLLKKGARLVSSVQDILEEFDLVGSKRTRSTVPKIPESQEEEIILKILTADPIHIDKLTKLAKLQTTTVSSVLAMMEIKGYVKNIGGQNYISL